MSGIREVLNELRAIMVSHLKIEAEQRKTFLMGAGGTAQTPLDKNSVVSNPFFVKLGFPSNMF